MRFCLELIEPRSLKLGTSGFEGTSLGASHEVLEAMSWKQLLELKLKVELRKKEEVLCTGKGKEAMHRILERSLDFKLMVKERRETEEW